MIKAPNSPGALVVQAAAAYFALVFAAGFLLALIRIPFLVPRFGERVAELLEMPLMLVVMCIASRYVVRRFALAASARLSIALGLFALVLLLAAELLLAVSLEGRSVAAYISDRDPISGSVYLASLLLYAVLPWLQFRKHRISVDHAA